MANGLGQAEGASADSGNKAADGGSGRGSDELSFFAYLKRAACFIGLALLGVLFVVFGLRSMIWSSSKPIQQKPAALAESRDPELVNGWFYRAFCKGARYSELLCGARKEHGEARE